MGLLAMMGSSLSDLPRKRLRGTLLSRLTVAVTALLICLWTATAWLLAGSEVTQRMTRRAERILQEAERSAEVVGLNLGRSIGHVRTIPSVIAADPGVMAALSRFGSTAVASPLSADQRQRLWQADTEFNALSRRLADIVSIAEIGISAVWVMNVAGDTFATGILPRDVNFLGTNYADRDYFSAAQHGETGVQFAVGRITGVPGLYFAAPVTVDGRFLGATGVRTNIDSLSRLMDPGMFVTDSNGVIVLAYDKNLLMHVAPNSRIGQVSKQDRDDRYKRQVFESLDVISDTEFGIPGLLRLKDAPDVFVMAVHSQPGDMLTVNALRRVDGIDTIRTDRIFLALMLAVIGTLVILSAVGAVFYVRSVVGHRRDLEQSLDVERRLVENQRQFILMMGHEVGTPLAIIDRSAEMVMDLLKPLPDQVALRLTAIRDSGRRLQRLIEDLLAAERVGLGGSDSIRLDAVEIVADAADTLDVGGERIILNVPKEAASFRGDGTLMMMVVTNLIDNALKYSPADQPVEIDVRQGGGEIVITVADHGIGFPDGELASAGQRFFRASNAGERRGTGLGLYIALRAVTAHHGRLDFHNRPGGGTVVTVHLPQDDRLPPR